MRIRCHWIYPTFYLGLTISPPSKYYVLGLGFISFLMDGYLDALEQGTHK